jgi:cytochrome o ubiquinol oxidase subunit II
MNKASKFILSVILVTAITLLLLVLTFMFSDKIAVLNPKGIIALKERNLMMISILLMLLVVIPVFIMTTLFAWRYRASNTKATYHPNWDYSLLIEVVCWGVSVVIILILSLITWRSSHELDPFTPLETSKKPITIQVVALQWKWLFIYPEYKIATVNFFHFPEQTPVIFEITADAPMNSFWIPQLGGQIYAMPGMKTKLYLMADELGDFRGSSANLSGSGFAGMTFIAKSTSELDFNQWTQSLKQAPDRLSFENYLQLAQPSKNNPIASFVLEEEGLFDQILMKYMMPKPVK